MVRSRQWNSGLLALVCACALVAPVAAWAAEPARDELTKGQTEALKAGLQLGAKNTVGKKSVVREANPFLATVPDVAAVDFSRWRRSMAKQADVRAALPKTRAAKTEAAGRALPAPRVYTETEPGDRPGGNDSAETAQLLRGFGTARAANPRAQVLGRLAETAVTPTPTPVTSGEEDNGQLDRASESTLDGEGAVSTTGVLGDGPHGSTGTGTNDFDFYRLRATAGLAITVATAGSPTDTVVAVYDSAGVLLGSNDDFGGVVGPSRLTVTVQAAGVHYVMVAGYSRAGSLPKDPKDARSGNGGGAEGAYSLSIESALVDTDFYGVNLRKGDVVGATVTGTATRMTVYRPDGVRMVDVATDQDASGLYPGESPLPGGGNATFAYVADRTGRHTVALQESPGAYEVTLEAYRPGSEVDPSTRVQTVFLDFDGARPNTAIWGGPGVRTLSPLSAFVAKWGLTAADEDALVRRVTETVRENLQRDLEDRSSNPDVAVRVLNSRDHADVFGQTNVSRVIVGGTMAESGLNTIGIAQFIDPGNFAHEDSAVVLLDLLSNECGGGSISLNCYLTADSDRLGFVARALANVVSHEAGHLVGSYHTDNLNDQHSLMDAGGANFQNLYGVGPDQVGGTADDEDVDLVLDDYAPTELFTGKEDTLNVAAWAFSRSRRS
jgi:hypothetical protein